MCNLLQSSQNPPIGINVKVLFPGEVSGVLRVIFRQSYEVLGQMLGRFEGKGVDVGMWRRYFAVLCAAEHDWYDVVPECVEKLLGDVIFAYRVLESKCEKIGALEVTVTGIVTRRGALVVAAEAVDVNVRVSPQFGNEAFPSA
ncbi:hypothetical protein MRX96_030376 [Rhipicephalus microplus]